MQESLCAEVWFNELRLQQLDEKGGWAALARTMNDLIDFGFIILISESKNQHQSRIVALSNFDKATDKALDKAHNKATDKALDTINKQRTKNKEKGSTEPLRQPKIDINGFVILD